MTNPNTPSELGKAYFTDLFTDIANAWNQGDREPYITKHVNSVYMVPNNATLDNPDSIRQFIDDFPDVNLQFDIIDVWGSQSHAGIHGRYNIFNPDGSLMDKGKFMGAFKEDSDEQWKMTHAIWNSDLPLSE
jgi:hypothetical protein